MVSALILVIILLLIFWLITLVWSQKVAKRVFKVVIYFGLVVAALSGIYVAYESYRWGSLLHQLNERSLQTTKMINAPAMASPLPQ